jgi:predicted nucleic acid-binding Zn ribbon protein
MTTVKSRPNEGTRVSFLSYWPQDAALLSDRGREVMARTNMRGMRILAITFAVAISLCLWVWASVRFPETMATVRGILHLLATGGDAPG